MSQLALSTSCESHLRHCILLFKFATNCLSFNNVRCDVSFSVFSTSSSATYTTITGHPTLKESFPSQCFGHNMVTVCIWLSWHGHYYLRRGTGVPSRLLQYCLYECIHAPAAVVIPRFPCLKEKPCLFSCGGSIMWWRRAPTLLICYFPASFCSAELKSKSFVIQSLVRQYK